LEYRTLGKTGLSVSAVGLGAWEIGGAVELTFEKLGAIAHGWGETDDKESLELIARCRDAGVNFIDTAPIYGDGHSEELIGRGLRTCRRHWIVCTKGGHGACRGAAWYDFSKKRLLEQMDESLARLRMDCVDVYLLHGPSAEHVRQGECMEALERMRDQGKTRFVGVSLGSNELGLELVRSGAVDVLQQAVSIVNPAAAAELLPAAAKAGVGIVARGIFGAGFLAGGVDEQTAFEAADRRSWQPAEQKRALSEKAGELRCLTRPDRSPAQLAVQYVLQLPGVSVALAGTSKWPHMAQDLAALESPRLDERELARIAELQERWAR